MAQLKYVVPLAAALAAPTISELTGLSSRIAKLELAETAQAHAAAAREAGVPNHYAAHVARFSRLYTTSARVGVNGVLALAAFGAPLVGFAMRARCQELFPETRQSRAPRQ